MNIKVFIIIFCAITILFASYFVARETDLFASAQVQSTLSPSPTPTPTASPTASPIPTPTATPTPTPTPTPTATEIPSPTEIPTSYMIDDIDFISQLPDYPTGCESVSAVTALNYLGIDITVSQFIYDYLDIGYFYYVDGVLYGPDPWEKFIGDPTTDGGFGCYNTTIENAVNKIIDTDEYTVLAQLDVSLEYLCQEYVANDIPVLIWATDEMATIRNSLSWKISKTGENFQWISPMHCLVLVGYDEEYYYFHDPLNNAYTAYSIEKTETAYQGLYSQSLVIVENSFLENKEQNAE